MKFSIIIPAYKDVYFEEAINSILNQTYNDWELIILDDCSPGRIADITKKYIIDGRIRYCRNSVNVGANNVVDNWNKCLSMARGEFLLCMGDDDMLYADCLSVYSRYIDEYPEYNLFHCATVIIDEKSELYSIQEARPLHESLYSMAWHRIARKRNQYIGDFLFRTNVLKQNGGFYKLPLAWGSDDITSYICAGVTGVLNIPEFLFKYRVNRYTISNSGDVLKKLLAISNKYQWVIDNIISKHPSNEIDEIYRKLITSMLSSAISREKISTLANCFGKNSSKTIYKLLFHAKKYKITFKQCVIAFALNLYKKKMEAY